MEGYKMYQAKILHREGMSATTIADTLQVTRRTVYNYLKGRVYGSKRRRGRPGGHSKLFAFCSHIKTRLEEDFSLNAEVLFEQLRRQGYQGRISILRDYLRAERTEMTNYAVLRFETSPGEQAQVDWADAGWIGEGAYRRRRYAFVMKLGYSRRSYVEFTESMEQSVLFACMEHAFDYFGGVPREILFDNMKTAFLFDAENYRWQAHPSMLLFGLHYGFTPKRCRVRRPKTKGKVEREIRYLRYSFFPTVSDMALVDNERLNDLVKNWLIRVDQKVLREFGQSRSARFPLDRQNLQSLPAVHFDYRRQEPLLVRRDGTVHYETNIYSVPVSLRGKTLDGRIDRLEHKLSIYDGERLLREYPLEPRGAHQSHIDPADKRELLKVWEEGRDAEQRRIEARAKRRRAEHENIVNHPAVYDQLFARETREVEA